MMTLSEFLLARIAEDEEAQRSESGWGRCDAPESYHWGPARVLAECEAKRRIVEDAIHQRQWIDSDPGAGDGGKGRLYCYDDVVAILALPYADHPDYDESWKP